MIITWQNDVAGRFCQPDERKSAQLRIRLTPEQRAILDAAAGGNTSTWARGVLLETARKEKKHGDGLSTNS